MKQCEGGSIAPIFGPYVYLLEIEQFCELSKMEVKSSSSEGQRPPNLFGPNKTVRVNIPIVCLLNRNIQISRRRSFNCSSIAALSRGSKISEFDIVKGIYNLHSEGEVDHPSKIFRNFSCALGNWWLRWDRMVVIIYGESENPRKIIKDSNFYPPFDFGN